VALLGRRDEPTDGVRDSCLLLSQAFARRGQNLEVADVRWDTQGWVRSLWRLWRESRSWAGNWVLFQYTALMWSRRGFPLGALAVLWILKFHGARICVVFHDVTINPASNLKQRIRVAFQYRTMRIALRWAERSVLTVPLEQVSNFPKVDRKIKNDGVSPSAVPTVAVFGISGGVPGAEEMGDIAYAMKRLQSQGILSRLMTMGRGSAEAEAALRKELNGSGMELSTLGVMPVEDFAHALAGADVLLCIRGHVSSRRGSAIAGIVCGLPIVGYRGEETGFPITEAGVMLVEMRDREGLVKALAQVLTDEKLQLELQERSREAAEKYFSWDSIAAKYAEVLFDT